ncbi:hypothetical protein PR202_gb25261 [Eleusine coracana subsp. coracana]|uniref:Leucine-rich repeat-containing N-terminal plant-type domain-containing protein n=1 Tax=Eleusine coracana subsp. coracana TaxID=191504 RepID=A0AAV5FPP1_ELECO|nr:hypothetical protein PR202_gb25261 [Eleusine coracana subsp. coracana]
MVVHGSSSQQCHEEDEAALLALNAGLGSPYHFESWSTDTWCCDWYDVDCDNVTGRVVGLSVFQDSNLTAGAIPDAVANLTHLRSLTLHHLPGLTGAIPESLSLLANLSVLTISYTGMSGPVPSFLSQLTSLTLLDLSYNSFTGAIPASLADLPNLTGINLSRNRLTGTIPPLLFNEQQQQQGRSVNLWLSHNELSGSIPAEFASVNFAYVDLSRNKFAFRLTGAELPEQLSFLDLSHNGIRGRIPEQLANLTNLQSFNVSYNKLCGQVPSGGVMSRFDAYSFQHNKCLCGAPLQACPKMS